jgi:hypothetical protein
MNSKAPALATWLLEHPVPGEKDAIAGDLVEEFRNGRSRAWFWRQALTVIFLAFCSESYRQRSASVFAMLWAGIVSVSWSHLLLASSQFQALVAWGIRRDWPESMVYCVGIFCAVNVRLVWAGPLVYLTIVDGFSLRGSREDWSLGCLRLPLPNSLTSHFPLHIHCPTAVFCLGSLGSATVLRIATFNLGGSAKGRRRVELREGRKLGMLVGVILRRERRWTPAGEPLPENWFAPPGSMDFPDYRNLSEMA